MQGAVTPAVSILGSPLPHLRISQECRLQGRRPGTSQYLRGKPQCNLRYGTISRVKNETFRSAYPAGLLKVPSVFKIVTAVKI